MLLTQLTASGSESSRASSPQNAGRSSSVTGVPSSSAPSPWYAFFHADGVIDSAKFFERLVLVGARPVALVGVAAEREHHQRSTSGHVALAGEE